MHVVERIIAIAAILVVGAMPSNGVENDFVPVGNFRASSRAIGGGVVSTTALSLGHCCLLCAASGSCAAVNYLAGSRWCELVAPTGLTWTADVTSKLLLKVDVMGASVPAGFQAVTGALIQSGRQEGFTSYSLQMTLTATACYYLCKVLTASCGLFAFHSQLNLCYVYDVDFYGTWTTTSTSDASWTSYYAQQPGSWKLLYKISKGINVDASDALFAMPGTATASSTQMAKDSTCACYLKNGIVDSWSKFPITQVSLVLATAGATMKFVNFSTTSTDTASTFFKQSKIVASSWTDLSATSTPAPFLFEIGTSTTNTAGRYFLIERVYNGCPGDAGWLSVNGKALATCTYDKTPVPQFAYIPGPVNDYNVNSAFADALMLYAKM